MRKEEKTMLEHIKVSPEAKVTEDNICSYCVFDEEECSENNACCFREYLREIEEHKKTKVSASYNPCDDCQYWQEMSKCKICEFYKFLQAEKAGKILVVQCSIGDKVFEVQEMRNWIQEYIVTSIHVSNHTIHYGWKIDYEAGLSGVYGNLKGFTTKSFGERVFLSREEAQKKLDELNSKEE